MFAVVISRTAFAHRRSIREAVTILESVVELPLDSAYAKSSEAILPQLRELIMDSVEVISDATH